MSTKKEYERDDRDGRKRQRHAETEEMPEMYSIFKGEVSVALFHNGTFLRARRSDCL